MEDMEGDNYVQLILDEWPKFEQQLILEEEKEKEQEQESKRSDNDYEVQFSPYPTAQERFLIYGNLLTQYYSLLPQATTPNNESRNNEDVLQQNPNPKSNPTQSCVNKKGTEELEADAYEEELAEELYKLCVKKKEPRKPKASRKKKK
ncbi:hypothetical protein M5689_016729 [Euphorbia peplus]|nr:hypothetical protein M5689_016729 [Euphorbia peplus]